MSTSTFLSSGYGCTVTLVTGDTMPTFTSMNEKAQPDMAPELWVNAVRTPARRRHQGRPPDRGCAALERRRGRRLVDSEVPGRRASRHQDRSGRVEASGTLPGSGRPFEGRCVQLPVGPGTARFRPQTSTRPSTPKRMASNWLTPGRLQASTARSPTPSKRSPAGLVITGHQRPSSANTR